MVDLSAPSYCINNAALISIVLCAIYTNHGQDAKRGGVSTHTIARGSNN